MIAKIATCQSLIGVMRWQLIVESINVSETFQTPLVDVSPFGWCDALVIICNKESLGGKGF
ncbi:MAG: hypothetical protein Q8755_02670 [Candidatus Phytoplasma australasiaticum]|nr:hypothetical protein [Candidatus Phytoplasma australasiaticum]